MNRFHLAIAAASPSETFFVIVGAGLAALAIATAAVGLWREDFPSAGALRGITALFTLLVLATATGAVVSARDEQEIRRAENEEAAKETEAETALAEEQEAPLGAGEAAEPGGRQGSEAADGTGGEGRGAGKALFVDAGCGGCHTLAGAGTTGTTGPDLDEALPALDAEGIRTAIVDPSASVAEGFPDGVMPGNYGDQLSEAELDLLVAYLADAAKGRVGRGR